MGTNESSPFILYIYISSSIHILHHTESDFARKREYPETENINILPHFVVAAYCTGATLLNHQLFIGMNPVSTKKVMQEEFIEIYLIL